MLETTTRTGRWQSQFSDINLGGKWAKLGSEEKKIEVQENGILSRTSILCSLFGREFRSSGLRFNGWRGQWILMWLPGICYRIYKIGLVLICLQYANYYLQKHCHYPPSFMCPNNDLEETVVPSHKWINGLTRSIEKFDVSWKFPEFSRNFGQISNSENSSLKTSSPRPDVLLITCLRYPICIRQKLILS